MNKEYWRNQATLETNVLIGDISQEDKESFFGPVFDFEVFHKVDDNLRYPQILGRFGFFKTNGAARKNGWDKDIPEGYSEHSIGKRKKKLYILKNTTGW